MTMDPMMLSMGPRTMGPNEMPMDQSKRLDATMPAHQRVTDELPWGSEIWQRIDKSVHGASLRPYPASDFLPRVGPMLDALTIDSDTTLTGSPVLRVDEAATFPLVEIWVEFVLTPQQVEREMELMTACTLAKRSANVLTQATDLLIFQGDVARERDPLFTEHRVHFRSGPAGLGLVGSVPEDPFHVVRVPAIKGDVDRFGDRTFRAVTEGCARLKSLGHYGPYVLVLHTFPYADTHAPLDVTLETPAELLRPLLAAGFCETGSLPSLTGLLISVGGNSMDLLVGRDATTTFLQQDAEGKYVFRVYQRFALRVKDPTAIVRLNFEKNDF